MFSWLIGSKDDDTASSDRGVPDVRTEKDPTPASPPRRRTWNAAFRDACLANGSLHASVSQALEQSEGGIDQGEIPTSSNAMYWKQDGSKEEIVRRFFQTAKHNNSPNENDEEKRPKPFIATTLFNVAATTAKSLTKGFWMTGDDLLMEQRGVKDDDSAEKEKETIDAGVDESQPLLNLDLAVDCLHFVNDTIARYVQGEENEDIIVLNGGPSSAAGVCQAWIARALANETHGQSTLADFVKNMASQDFRFLLEALEDCGVVKILKRRPAQDDLLMFLVGDDSSPNEFKLAMFDLNRQIDTIQKRIETLVTRKEAATQAALHCRKTKQERQAMHHMKLRKTLEDEIGKLQSTIQNLESQRLALENSVGNREILKVSQQTANVLKSLRRESDNVDEILSDLQDEMDQQREIEDALAHTADPGGMIDDDELLAELDNLKLDDDDAPAPNDRLPDGNKLTGEASVTTTTEVAPTVGNTPSLVDAEPSGQPKKKEDRMEGVEPVGVLEEAH